MPDKIYNWQGSKVKLHAHRRKLPAMEPGDARLQHNPSRRDRAAGAAIVAALVLFRITIPAMLGIAVLGASRFESAIR